MGKTEKIDVFIYNISFTVRRQRTDKSYVSNTFSCSVEQPSRESGGRPRYFAGREKQPTNPNNHLDLINEAIRSGLPLKISRRKVKRSPALYR